MLPLLLSIALSLTANARSLPALKISEVTVSGISSGAFMAVQLGTAFSSTIKGVGSIAGGPYWCAEGNASRSRQVCMGDPSEVNPESLAQKARDLAKSGKIDPVAGIKSQKVFVFSSAEDAVVKPPAGQKLTAFYRALGVKEDDIHSEFKIPSGHGFPTLDQGIDCILGMPPWINNCKYDGAGTILAHLHGKLQARGKMNPTHLSRFTQAEYAVKDAPLLKEGWIYVPSDCAKGAACRLHVALHGCMMSEEFVQDKFVRMTGYNEWAETNRTVVLYPQSSKQSPLNPFGCWDWFGYSGQNYAEKSGQQMSAVWRMIQAVRGR